MRVGQTRKRDSNEREIVNALRYAGAKVHRISSKGFADLIVHHHRVGLVLIEVKSDRGKDTEAQVQHRQDGWPVHLVRTVQQAMALLQ